MKSGTYTLSVVVPMYNEVEMISMFYERLTKILNTMNLQYEIIFVDDGSSDGTFEHINRIAQREERVVGIKFSRNFGHQMALMAGLKEASGQYILMMDGDLQHPPELIPDLWKHAMSGIDVVYTIRKELEDATWFKKTSSSLFYRLFLKLCTIELQRNTADFRLISRKVCEEIIRMDERDLFLRGMFSWIGFQQHGVEYIAQKRMRGYSKYTIKKMVTLALNGITSFSTVPLVLSSVLFCICSLFLAGFYSVYALYVKFIAGGAVQGWTSLIILMCLFFSGIFINLTILGIYIAKIHTETQKRPRYLIEAITKRHAHRHVKGIFPISERIKEQVT